MTIIIIIKITIYETVDNCQKRRIQERENLILTNFISPMYVTRYTTYTSLSYNSQTKCSLKSRERLGRCGDGA